MWKAHVSGDDEKLEVTCLGDGKIALRSEGGHGKYLGRNDNGQITATFEDAENPATHFVVLDFPSELQVLHDVRVISVSYNERTSSLELAAQPGHVPTPRQLQQRMDIAETKPPYAHEPPVPKFQVHPSVLMDDRYHSIATDGNVNSVLLSDGDSFAMEGSRSNWILFDMGEARQFSRVSLKTVEVISAPKTVKFQCTNALEGPWEDSGGTLWEVSFEVKQSNKLQHFKFPGGASPEKRWWRVVLVDNHGDPKETRLTQILFGGSAHSCCREALGLDSSGTEGHNWCVSTNELFGALGVRSGGRGLVELDDFRTWWRGLCLVMFGAEELKRCLPKSVEDGIQRAWEQFQQHDLLPCAAKVSDDAVGTWLVQDSTLPWKVNDHAVHTISIDSTGNLKLYRDGADRESEAFARRRHASKRCLQSNPTFVVSPKLHKNGITCRGCEKRPAVDSQMYGCRVCDYDLCVNCYSDLDEKLGPSREVQKKQPQTKDDRGLAAKPDPRHEFATRLSWNPKWTDSTDKDLKWEMENENNVAILEDVEVDTATSIVVANIPFPESGLNTVFVRISCATKEKVSVGVVTSFEDLHGMKDEEKKRKHWIDGREYGWSLYNDGDGAHNDSWNYRDRKTYSAFAMKGLSTAEGHIVGVTIDADQRTLSIESNNCCRVDMYTDLPEKVYLAVGLVGSGRAEIVPSTSYCSYMDLQQIQTGPLPIRALEPHAWEIDNSSKLPGLWTLQGPSTLVYRGYDGTSAVMHLAEQDWVRRRRFGDFEYPADDSVNERGPFTASIAEAFHREQEIQDPKGRTFEAIAAKWNKDGVAKTQTKCKSASQRNACPEPLARPREVYLRRELEEKNDWYKDQLAMVVSGPDSSGDCVVERVSDGERLETFKMEDVVRATKSASIDSTGPHTSRHLVPSLERLQGELPLGTQVVLRQGLASMKGLRAGELATVRDVFSLPGQRDKFTRYALTKIDGTRLLYFAVGDLAQPDPNGTSEMIAKPTSLSGIVDAFDFHRFIAAACRCQPSLTRLMNVPATPPSSSSTTNEGAFLAREMYRCGQWAVHCQEEQQDSEKHFNVLRQVKITAEPTADSDTIDTLKKGSIVIKVADPLRGSETEDSEDSGFMYVRRPFEQPLGWVSKKLDDGTSVLQDVSFAPPDPSSRLDCINVFKEALEYDIAGTVTPPEKFDKTLQRQQETNTQMLESTTRWFVPMETSAKWASPFPWAGKWDPVLAGESGERKPHMDIASAVYGFIVREAEAIVVAADKKGGGGLMLDAEMVQEQEQEQEVERDDVEEVEWHLDHGRRKDTPEPWKLSGFGAKQGAKADSRPLLDNGTFSKLSTLQLAKRESAGQVSLEFPEGLHYSNFFGEAKHTGAKSRRLKSVFVVLEWTYTEQGKDEDTAQKTVHVAISLAEAQTLRRLLQETQLPPEVASCISLFTSDGMYMTSSTDTSSTSTSATYMAPSALHQSPLSLALLCFRFFNSGTYYTRAEQFKLVQLLGKSPASARREFFEAAVACRRKDQDEKGIGRALKMMLTSGANADMLRYMFDLLDQIEDYLQDNSADIRSRFSELDKDGSGELDAAEFSFLWSNIEMDPPVTKQQAADLFKFVDESSTGQVSFTEFAAAFKSTAESDDQLPIRELTERRRTHQLKRVTGDGFASLSTTNKEAETTFVRVRFDQDAMRQSFSSLSLRQLRAEALGAGLPAMTLAAVYDEDDPSSAMVDLLIQDAKRRAEQQGNFKEAKRFQELASTEMVYLLKLADDSPAIGEEEVNQVFEQTDPKIALVNLLMSAENKRQQAAAVNTIGNDVGSAYNYAAHLVLRSLTSIGGLVRILGSACVLGADNAISTTAGTCTTIGTKGVILTSGSWYYELEVVACVSGACRAAAGYCDVEFTCGANHGNDGVGKDRNGHSWALGGHSKLGGRLYKGSTLPAKETFSVETWAVGDIIGCGVEIDGAHVSIQYWRNGIASGVAFDHSELGGMVGGLSPAVSVEFGVMLKLNLGETAFRFGVPGQFSAVNEWVLQRAADIRWLEAGTEAGGWIAGTNAQKIALSTDGLPTGSVEATPIGNAHSEFFDMYTPGICLASGRWYYEVTVLRETSTDAKQRDLRVGWGEHSYVPAGSGPLSLGHWPGSACLKITASKQFRPCCGKKEQAETLEGQSWAKLEELKVNDTIGCLIDMQTKPFTVAYRVLRENVVIFPQQSTDESEASATTHSVVPGMANSHKLTSSANNLRLNEIYKPAVSARGFDVKINMGPKFLEVQNDVNLGAQGVYEWIKQHDRLPGAMLGPKCAEVADTALVSKTNPTVTLVPSSGLTHVQLQRKTLPDETGTGEVEVCVATSQMPTLRARLSSGSLANTGRWYYEVKLLRLHNRQELPKTGGDQDEQVRPKRPDTIDTRLAIGWCDETFFGGSAAKVSVGSDRNGWALAFDTVGGVHKRHRTETRFPGTTPPDFLEFADEVESGQWAADREAIMVGDQVELSPEVIKSATMDIQELIHTQSPGIGTPGRTPTSLLYRQTTKAGTPKDVVLAGKVTAAYRDGPEDAFDVAVELQNGSTTLEKVALKHLQWKIKFKKGARVQYKNIHSTKFHPNDAYEIGIVNSCDPSTREYNIRGESDKKLHKSIPRRFVEHEEFDEFVTSGNEIHWPYHGTGGAWFVNDVIGCAVDVDAGTISFYRNGKRIQRSRMWQADKLFGKPDKDDEKAVAEKADWLTSEKSRASTSKPVFTRVKSMHGLQPCITVGQGMQVACSFGPTAFAQGALPPGHSWVSDWKAGRGQQHERKQANDVANLQSDVGPSADVVAQTQLDSIPENLMRKLPSEKRRDMKPAVFKHLQSLWQPEKEWSTIDISGMTIAAGNGAEAEAEYEGLLHTLQAAFDDPWVPGVGTGLRGGSLFVRKKDQAVCSVGRPVAVFKANDCQLTTDASKESHGMSFGFGEFLNYTMAPGMEGVKPYEKSGISIPPVNLFRDNLRELHLRGNKIREHDMYVLCERAKHCTNLLKLNLSGNELGTGGVQYLVDMLLEIPALTHLGLAGSSVNQNGCMVLSNRWLRYAFALETLDISGNSIGPTGLSALTEAISTEHSLVSLNISRISVGPAGGEIVAMFLRSFTNLTELDVSTNDFGPSAGQIAEALANPHEGTTSSLKCLRIAHNGIGPGRAMDHFADLLKEANEADGTCPHLQIIDLSNNRITALGCDKVIRSIKFCGLRSFTMRMDQTITLEKQVELIVAMKGLSLRILDMGSLVQIVPDDGVAPSRGKSVSDFFSRPLAFAVEHSFFKLAKMLIHWRNNAGLNALQPNVTSDRSALDRFVSTDDSLEAMRLAIRLPAAEHLVWDMIGKHGDEGIVYEIKTRIKCVEPVTREILADTSIEIATDLWSCHKQSDADGNTALLCALNYDCVDVAMAIIKRNRARACVLTAGVQAYVALEEFNSSKTHEEEILRERSDGSTGSGRFWCCACARQFVLSEDHTLDYCDHPVACHRQSEKQVDVYLMWPDLANVNAEDRNHGAAVTAIRLAASKGYTEIVDELCRVGCDITMFMNVPDDKGRLAVHDACRAPYGSASESYLKNLLDNCAVLTKDHLQSKSPVHYAAALGHTELIQVLFTHISSTSTYDISDWIDTKMIRSEATVVAGWLRLKTQHAVLPRLLVPWSPHYVIVTATHIKLFPGEKGEQDFKRGNAPSFTLRLQDVDIVHRRKHHHHFDIWYSSSNKGRRKSQQMHDAATVKGKEKAPDDKGTKTKTDCYRKRKDEQRFEKLLSSPGTPEGQRKSNHKLLSFRPTNVHKSQSLCLSFDAGATGPTEGLSSTTLEWVESIQSSAIGVLSKTGISRQVGTLQCQLAVSDPFQDMSVDLSQIGVLTLSPVQLTGAKTSSAKISSADIRIDLLGDGSKSRTLVAKRHDGRRFCIRLQFTDSRGRRCQYDLDTGNSAEHHRWFQSLHRVTGYTMMIDSPPWTAIGLASLHGHKAIVREMCEIGSDPLLLFHDSSGDGLHYGRWTGYHGGEGRTVARLDQTAPSAYKMAVIWLNQQSKHGQLLEKGQQGYLVDLSSGEELKSVDQDQLKHVAYQTEISTQQMIELHNSAVHSAAWTCNDTRQRFAVEYLVRTGSTYLIYLGLMTLEAMLLTSTLSAEPNLEFHNDISAAIIGEDNVWGAVNSYDSFVEFVEALFVGLFTDHQPNVLAVPLLVRQYRSTEQQCDDIVPLAGGSECFTFDDEDQTRFGPNGEWEYSHRSGTWLLDWDDWPVSGFAQSFDANQTNASALLRELDMDHFFDAATRVVHLDMTMHNPSSGAFETAELVAEFARSGGVETRSRFAVVIQPSLTRLLVEWSLFCYLCFYAYGEVAEMQRLRELYGKTDGVKYYLSDFWNLADWVMIALLMSLAVIEWHGTLSFNQAVQSLEHADETSTELFIAVAWYAKQQQLVLAFTLSLAYIKAFKFVKLLPVLGPAFYAAVATMANGQVLLFLMIFMYFVLAVGLGCHVAFGMHVDGFGSIFESFLAIFQASFSPVRCLSHPLIRPELAVAN